MTTPPRGRVRPAHLRRRSTSGSCPTSSRRPRAPVSTSTSPSSVSRGRCLHSSASTSTGSRRRPSPTWSSTPGRGPAPGCVCATWTIESSEITDDGRGRPMPRSRHGGLGLTGMKERAAAMRGTIVAERRGSGQIGRLPRAGHRSRCTHHQDGAAVNDVESTNETVRVVLVDDHAMMREGISVILQSSGGIEVVGVAGNGREAVSVVRELAPDVVCMDVEMPVMDGLEATRQSGRPVGHQPGAHAHHVRPGGLPHHRARGGRERVPAQELPARAAHRCDPRGGGGRGAAGARADDGRHQARRPHRRRGRSRAECRSA